MRITISQDEQSSEDEGYTPSQSNREETLRAVSRMNTASKARLQAIKDRVASHTPYTATRSRRRGIDGVQRGPMHQNGGENEEQTTFSLPQVFHSPAGSSFASKLLSVATTPLRAAWGIVANQLRTPSASPLGHGDAGAVGDRAGIDGTDMDRDKNNDSVMAQDKKFGASPASPTLPVRSVPERNGEGQSPRRTRRTTETAVRENPVREGPSADASPLDNGPREVRTPFDGVLDMLKEGPMAGGTPARHPPPSKSASAMKGVPQSMRAPRSAQPAFTFDATKQRLMSSVPAKQASGAPMLHPARGGTPAQTRKKMVFGSQRGTAVKDMPLAWTPLRSTPLVARSTGPLRTRFAPSSRFAPTSKTAGHSFGAAGGETGAMASRKRRADDINGLTPSLDDGSVSLLDMQRRRRFKPSEDPGSMQRRSWRAGRTPYSHMARYRRRIDEDEGDQDASGADVGATDVGTGPVTASPSPLKATTETARRILETLDSMEEKIRRSKEQVSPVDAKMYTLDATAAPPPGASLGGAMLSTKTTVTETPPVAAPTVSGMPTAVPSAGTTTVSTLATGANKPFLSVQEATPIPVPGAGAGSWKTIETTKKMFGTSPPSSSERPSGGIKKRSRFMGGAEIVDGDQVDEPGATTVAMAPPVDIPAVSSSPRTESRTPAVAPVPEVPAAVPLVAATPPPSAEVAFPQTSASEFTFGRKINSVKNRVDKAIQGVTPSVDATTFAFGKDKPAAFQRLQDISTDKPVVTVTDKPTEDRPFTLPTPGSSFGAAIAKDDVLPGPDAAVQAAPVQTSGWGSDFLKKNAAAAVAAASAAADEANKNTAPEPVASAFKLGAPATSAGTEAPAIKPAFQFGSKPAAQTGSLSAVPAFSFGNTATVKDDTAPSASAPLPVLTAVDGEVGKADKLPEVGEEPSSNITAKTCPELTKVAASTTTDAVGEGAAPKVAFSFGASSTPATASTAIGAVPEEKKPASSPGWGADFLAKNAQQASAATEAVEKELKQDAPSFKFGASLAHKTDEKPSEIPQMPEIPPAFKFGAPAASGGATAPPVGSAFQFGSSTPAATGASADSAAPSAPEAPSIPAFSFGAPTLKKTDTVPAPAPPTAMPTFGAAAASAEKKEEVKATTTVGFAFGASSNTMSKETGGFGSSFGTGSFGGQTTASPVFGSSGASFGGAASVPGFSFGGQVAGEQKPGNTSGFAFGSQPAATSAFGAPAGSSGPLSTNAFGTAAPSGGFAAPNAFGAAPSTGSFGGFGSSQPSGFGGAAPFGAASSTAAFGAPATQENRNVFGQSGGGQFGAPASQNVGFQASAFGAPSAFPQSSGPSQMIPNNPENPFGGGNAGGFNLGSSGTAGTQSRSEGRRKVRVKRRH